MNNFKNAKENFSRAAIDYNKHSEIQDKAAKSLVSSISSCFDLSSISFIVDLGCGTGYVSDEIFQLTGKKVDLSIDFSMNSVNLVNNSRSKVVADIRSLPFTRFSSGKSLITSSFAFQWLNIQEIRKLVAEIVGYVQKGSIIALSIPIDNSFYQFLDANKLSGANFRMLSLPDGSKFKDIFSCPGVELLNLKHVDYDKGHKNAQDFLRSIKRIGAGCNFLGQNIVNTKKIKKLNDILFEKYDNVITWKTIEIIIKKT